MNFDFKHPLDRLQHQILIYKLHHYCIFFLDLLMFVEQMS